MILALATKLCFPRPVARTWTRAVAARSFHASTQLDDRIVIAVGGNALQRRGERLTIENMLKAAAEM